MKERIVSTARDLFSEYGYFNVSMSQIAKRLKITKPALYYYFSSKKEILREVIKEVFSDLKEILKKAQKETTPEKKVKKFIQEYFEFVNKENILVKLSFFKFPSPELRIYFENLKKEFLQETKSIFKEFFKTSKTKADYCDEFLSFILATLNGFAQDLSEKKSNTKKLVKKIWQIYFKGRK
jgi:AcrR family transcriptional regulator